MPTYTYQCDHCSHQFDAFQKITDEPLVKCPKCEKEQLKKIITSGNFVLKGEKWFRNSGSY